MKLGSDEAVSTSNMDMAHTRTEGTIGGKARYRWDGIIQLGRQDTYWKVYSRTEGTISGKARYRWDGIIQLGGQDTYWKARYR